MIRYEINIREAENGYVVKWGGEGFADDAVLLCLSASDVIREVTRIIEHWKVVRKKE